MPTGRFRPRRVAIAVLAVAMLGGAAAVVATGPLEEISAPAVSGSRAERVVEPAQTGDVVAVFNIGELQTSLANAVAAAAADSGGSWAPSRSATIGMVALRRGAQVVQQPPPGFRYPVIVTALPPAAIRGVMGTEIAAVLGPTSVVMGETTAQLRSAKVDDVIEVVADDGTVRPLRIAMIASDRAVGGAEVLMTAEAADRLGIRRASRAVIWGFSSRTAIDVALNRHGIPTRRETRASKSWDPPNPDSTLSTARTKALLGEFAYRVTADGTVRQEDTWASANLPAGRELLNEQIRIRARCHNQVAGDLRAALAEVAAAGLGGAIDVANANAYGGCHYPRFNRISAEFGFLSRHSWGMAFDTNTVTNCQGCVPKMDCRVVQIFRTHNFAWGGNFLRPDGMHFEWVGEPRHQIRSTSGFCPNPTGVSAQTLDPGADGRDRIFADETLSVEHDHDHD